MEGDIMPIYEYKCKKCGNNFDMYQEINSDNEQVECPMCGEKHSERVYSIFRNMKNDNYVPRFSGG